jgi:hypothetical protein
MRIPLPKSKLVTLAIVALVGSGMAAAALASPTLWSDSAEGAIGDRLASIPATFAAHDDDGPEDEDDRGWDDDDDERYEDDD